VGSASNLAGGDLAMTSDYSGLKLYDKEAVAGGPASKAIVALGKHLQDSEGSFK
jgi:hypothetical protein